MKNNRPLFWLLAAFTAFNLFFINKAYHIDDPFTLTIAKAVAQNFIRVPQVFQGCPVLLGQVCDNPLFLGYYYAPIIKIFGDRELWMHLFYLPFALLCIISMYILARRFTGRSILPVLFLMVSPVFIVMSQGIMLDIPLLAFFLSALCAFIFGVDREDKKLLFLSAVLASLAVLTKYSGLLALMAMAVYAVLAAKKRYLAYLLIPLLALSLWCLHNLIFYGRVFFLEGILMKGPGFSLEVLALRKLAVLSFLSGASISAVFLVPFLLRTKINRLLFCLSLPAGLLPFLARGFSTGFPIYAQKGFFFSGYTLAQKSILALFFVCSFFIILLVFKAGCANIFRKDPDKDDLFLCAWFTLVLTFTVLVQFVAARFVLLLYPAMFLILAKELGLRKGQPPAAGRAVFLPAIIAGVFSAILAVGDYQAAGIYRDFACGLKNKLPGEKVNFCPDSFDTNLCYGYAYYLRKYYPLEAENKFISREGGARQLLVRPEGTLLSPLFYTNCADYPGGYDKKLINSFSYAGSVFLHNRSARCGFYSHDWGLLPFSISFKKMPLEVFGIYQITLANSKNDTQA